MQRYDRPRRILGTGIAALAGYVDAVGFLSADRYFVSFMSGNTTRLAVDMTQRPQQAIIPLALIGGFVTGVTIGAIISDHAGQWRKTWILAFAAILLGGACITRWFGHTAVMMAFMVLAMGALNNAFRRDGNVAVGVTYMTGSLVSMGQAIAARMQGRVLPGWANPIALWLALVTGAIIGARVFTAWPFWALIAATAWTALLTLWARYFEGHSA